MQTLKCYLNKSLRRHISVEITNTTELPCLAYINCMFKTYEVCGYLATKIKYAKHQEITVEFSDKLSKKFFKKAVYVIHDVNIERPKVIYNFSFADKNINKRSFETVQFHIFINIKNIREFITKPDKFCKSYSMSGDFSNDIFHEMLNAYEDWELTIEGKGGLSKLLDNEFKHTNEINKDKLVDCYKYFFMEPEKNMYIEELCEQMRKDMLKVGIYDKKATKRVLDKFSKTDTYRNYINFMLCANELTPNDKEFENLIKLRTFHGMTNDEVIRKLKNCSLKLKNQMEKVIAKILCDCVEIIWPPRNVVFTPVHKAE